MRRQLSILFCLIAGITFNVNSAILTSRAALAQAVKTPRLVDTYTLHRTITDRSDAPAIYEFANGENTLYVSADSDAPQPLLGWTDTPLSDIADMPPAMTEWLQLLADNVYTNSASTSHYTAIEPMLATEWNQTTPYNLYCPIISGSHAPVGCVATAMAMIVHNNRFFSGQEMLTVSDNNGNPLDVDLQSLQFDFDSMPLTSASSGNWDQVALLSALCGVGVNMHYSLSGSGAYLTDVPRALTQYMGYDATTIYLQRSNYTIREWIDIIYNELAHGRPVLYAGGITSPHAFVCDGYQPGNYFHFNWGWGGNGNGYFALSSLIPPVGGVGASTSNNYTGAQECVLCRPPQSQAASLWLKVSGYCTPQSTDRIKVMFNVVGPSGEYNVNAGYIVENAAGTVVKQGDIGQVTCRTSASTSSGVTITTSQATEGLSQGTYTMYPAYYRETDNQLVKASEPKGDYALTIEIGSDGTVGLNSNTAAARLWAEEAKVHGQVYKTTSPDISFRLVNTGRKDCYTSVTLAIVDPATEQRLRLRTLDNVELASESSAIYRTTVSSYLVGSGYLPAGDYHIGIYEGSTDSLLAIFPRALTVLADQDPSVVSASANPNFTVERINTEPELLLAPYNWNHDVYLSCSSTQSTTLGVGFFAPGGYTPIYKYTIPYQRIEKCNRSRITIDPGEINPTPGSYEVAYLAGGIEISKRLSVTVPLRLDNLYFTLDSKTMTASVVAASADLNGHTEVPAEIYYNGESYKITKIAADAFAGCPTLLSVSIPSTVKTIEGDIFTGSQPTSLIIRANQPPFMLWQSVFNGMLDLPVVYVPNSAFDSYQQLLPQAEVYSAITSLELAQDAKLQLALDSAPVDVQLTINPVCATYHQSLLVNTDRQDIASVELIEYHEGGATLCLTPHAEGSCILTLSHPQPDIDPMVYTVTIGPEASAIELVEAPNLSVLRTANSDIIVSGALSHESVTIIDLTGCILYHGYTDCCGYLHIKLSSAAPLVIAKIGNREPQKLSLPLR